jgi:Spy/CpxP family protein refolding chaperone
MKKFLLPLLAAVAISFSAAAQAAPPQEGGRPRHSPQEMADHQAQRLSKELNLNADQSAKVAQILTARTQDMQAMRGQQPATDRQQMRAQMQANRAKYDDQLKQVLTPEQLTKYTALEASHRRGPGLKDGKLKAKDGKLKMKAKPTKS